MPEELKPCPACGGEARYWQDDHYIKGLEAFVYLDGPRKGEVVEGKVWHFVQCKSCGKQEAKALHPDSSELIEYYNALPRDLTWTHEPPTVPGLYAVILHDEDQPRLHHHFAAPDAEDAKTVKYWLGPLPSPFGAKL